MTLIDTVIINNIYMQLSRVIIQIALSSFVHMTFVNCTNPYVK